MIEVSELTKVYGQTLAVDHVSFQVDKGIIVGFLGPNGAGKSTTLKMLTCYLPPTAAGRPSPASIFSINPNTSDKISDICPKTYRSIWK